MIICLAFACVSAQRNMRGRKDLKVSNIEQFHLMVFPQASSEKGKIKLNAYIMIPSYALQFVKDNGGFKSSFEARIRLLDDEGNQLDNKSISETLLATDYLETIRKSNWYFVEYDFHVKPGKYTIVSEVMDIDTRNSGLREKKVDLSKYKDEFILFPPQVMIDYTGTWQGENRLMPSYQNEISFQQSFIPIYVTGNVFSENYSLKLVLKDMDGISVSKLDTTFTNIDNYFTHQLNMPVTEVGGLRVELFVALEQGENSDEEVIELKIKRPGISSYIRDIDEAIDQMRYILNNDERSKLSKAKKKDKEELFYTYWKDRDPTPETSNNELMDQYYSRVRYSNDHFTSFTPGWRTDMGMIYILFGPPDDIERQYMNSNRNAQQNWYYYRINRSFTFFDENGFGDYRLTTPYIYGRTW